MRSIDMLPDYEILVSQAEDLGKFAAYRAYTEKYPQLFSFIFDHLFMAPIEALKPLIEGTHFDTLLELSRQNHRDGLTGLIEEITLESARQLGFSGDFNLFLGVNLGNIGGTIVDPKTGLPGIYIGTDRAISPDFIRQIVPHEMNHMVRVASTGKNPHELNAFTERTVSEGLAVLNGLVFAGQNFSWESFALQNGLNQAQLSFLKENSNDLAKQVRSNFGKALTPELHHRFFVNRTGDPSACLPGYFYGTKIVASLVDAGNAIEELTVMPVEEILSRYDALEKGPK